MICTWRSAARYKSRTRSISISAQASRGLRVARHPQRFHSIRENPPVSSRSHDADLYRAGIAYFPAVADDGADDDLRVLVIDKSAIGTNQPFTIVALRISGTAAASGENRMLVSWYQDEGLLSARQGKSRRQSDENIDQRSAQRRLT